MTVSLFPWMAMSMTIGVIGVLGYTTFVLHKVHAHARRVQLAAPAGSAPGGRHRPRHRHRLRPPLGGPDLT